jgi:hypothetical protein
MSFGCRYAWRLVDIEKCEVALLRSSDWKRTMGSQIPKSHVYVPPRHVRRKSPKSRKTQPGTSGFCQIGQSEKRVVL